MKKLQTAIAILSVLIVAVAVVLTAKYCGRAEEETTTTETATTSTEISTKETITEVLTEKTTTDTTTSKKAVETQYTPKTESNSISAGQFKRDGIIYTDEYKFTWYSEKVLPGGGLNIPGRYSDGDYVRDENDYIVLASRDLPKGTIVETPFGDGKVYDVCRDSGTIDVYTSF